MLQSGPFNSAGRNISALVGYTKKLRALYEVTLLENYYDSTVESHFTGTRKKLQKSKLKKSQTAPWKWHFSPDDDFLGLQQSLCNINFSFGIFMSKYQRKNLLKCIPPWLQNQSKWSILMASFWQQFSHSKRDFWLKSTIREKFYIFWESDEQKILQLSLTVSIHERNAFTWSANFFTRNFI